MTKQPFMVVQSFPYAPPHASATECYPINNGEPRRDVARHVRAYGYDAGEELRCFRVYASDAGAARLMSEDQRDKREPAFMFTVPHTWTEGMGRLEIEMTLEQAQSASHQGDCSEDIKALVRELNLSLDPDKVRDSLREYGAWDDDELADDATNLQRIVWIAACDLNEEYGA